MKSNLDTDRIFHVFDQVDEPILALDSAHRLIYFNAQAADLFGIEAQDRSETLPAELFSPTDPNLQCEEILSIAAMKGSWRGDTEHVLRNGTHIRTECSVSAISDEAGGRINYLVIARDISRFAAQTSWNVSQHDPYFLLGEFHKMEALGRMAGIVAHDFNNHLAGILGNLAVAVRKMDDAHPVHHLLMAARGSAERSSALVKQLLTFSRRSSSELEPVNLNDTLEALRNEHSPNGTERSALFFEKQDALPPILGDSAQISQAAGHLVMNAQEAAGASGTVTIRTKTENAPVTQAQIHPGKYAILEIEDNGPGMDSATQSHMFEPFFSSKERKGIVGGGMGLSIVWGIVQRHGGHIEVASDVGRGTVVRLYFPVYSTACIDTLHHRTGEKKSETTAPSPSST